MNAILHVDRTGIPWRYLPHFPPHQSVYGYLAHGETDGIFATGRRGTGAAVLVEKLLGGAADPGALGVAVLFWSHARARKEAPGELTAYLPTVPGTEPPA